jgi:hypothetical protein
VRRGGGAAVQLAQPVADPADSGGFRASVFGRPAGTNDQGAPASVGVESAALSIMIVIQMT